MAVKDLKRFQRRRLKERKNKIHAVFAKCFVNKIPFCDLPAFVNSSVSVFISVSVMIRCCFRIGIIPKESDKLFYSVGWFLWVLFLSACISVDSSRFWIMCSNLSANR